jgi:hypothetical protein
MEEPEDTRPYIKKYMIAYYTPGTKDPDMIYLPSKTYEDAEFLARCTFGVEGPKYLYFKKIYTA